MTIDLMVHGLVGAVFAQFLGNLAHQAHGCNHSTTSDADTYHSHSEQFRSGWTSRHCQQSDWTGNVSHHDLDDCRVDEKRNKNAVGSCLKIGPAALNGFLQPCLSLAHLCQVRVSSSIDNQVNVSM